MTRRIIYNEDSQGVAETRPGSVEKDLRAWVDKPLSRIPVDTYAWCIAFPDIVMHNSRVGEVYGQRFDSPPDQVALAVAELIEQGTDILHMVADQAHYRGVEFVASVRMGDTHRDQPDSNNVFVSQFLLNHPEYVIKRQDGIPETALDYSYAEVRSHRLAILRELAEDYDIDGLELDFTRFGKYFARHEAPFKVSIITEFVRRVREILDNAARKRGRDRLVLGVQVLRSLYLNLLCGLDPKIWVENGWIGYIIQCDFNCTDPQIPVAEFAEFCRDSQCSHHVRMGNMMGGRWTKKPHSFDRKTAYKNIRGYGGMILSPEEARGAAANIYGFGADGIGLWNLCCNMGPTHKSTAHPNMSREEFQQDIFAWANEVANPTNVWSRRRVYHFVPIYKSEQLMAHNYAVNELRQGPLGEPVQIVMFRPNSHGIRQVYRFIMADGKDGQDLSGFMRWRILQSTPEDRFTFDINGQPIDSTYVNTEFVNDDELPYVWYQVDLAKCPRFAGCNELGITMIKLATLQPRSSAESVYEAFPYVEELIVSVEPR